jgi:hypothetical protein
MIRKSYDSIITKFSGCSTFEEDISIGEIEIGKQGKRWHLIISVGKNIHDHSGIFWINNSFAGYLLSGKNRDITQFSLVCKYAVGSCHLS